jgi:hypothetical protein
MPGPADLSQFVYVYLAVPDTVAEEEVTCDVWASLDTAKEVYHEHEHDWADDGEGGLYSHTEGEEGQTVRIMLKVISRSVERDWIKKGEENETPVGVETTMKE